MVKSALRTWLMERLAAKVESTLDWHRWFAWHPVRMDNGEWKWLCFLERRGDITPDFDFVFMYRLPNCSGVLGEQ